jgi:hypothetical protein
MDNGLDPVPAPVRSLMLLLAGDLATVRFPDVDGELLATAAREVEAAAEAVADAEVALEAARQLLGDQQEALLTRAHRAFGYLRVFAEGDAQLEARLSPIALPRRGRGNEAATAAGEPIARRRGRPPKSDKGAPLLAGMRATDVLAGAVAAVAVTPTSAAPTFTAPTSAAPMRAAETPLAVVRAPEAARMAEPPLAAAEARAQS